MSDERRHRAQDVEVHELSRMLAEAEAPEIVLTSGHGQGYFRPVQVGGFTHYILCPPAGTSAETLELFSARDTATVTGRCPICGGRRRLRDARRPEVRRLHHLVLVHADGCPVSDTAYAALVRQECPLYTLFALAPDSLRSSRSAGSHRRRPAAGDGR